MSLDIQIPIIVTTIILKFTELKRCATHCAGYFRYVISCNEHHNHEGVDRLSLILQMRKLGLREIEQLTQSHTAMVQTQVCLAPSLLSIKILVP